MRTDVLKMHVAPSEGLSQTSLDLKILLRVSDYHLIAQQVLAIYNSQKMLVLRSNKDTNYANRLSSQSDLRIKKYDWSLLSIYL